MSEVHVVLSLVKFRSGDVTTQIIGVCDSEDSAKQKSQEFQTQMQKCLENDAVKYFCEQVLGIDQMGISETLMPIRGMISVAKPNLVLGSNGRPTKNVRR